MQCHFPPLLMVTLLLWQEALRQTHQAKLGRWTGLAIRPWSLRTHHRRAAFLPAPSSSAMEGVMMDALAEEQKFQPHGAFLGTALHAVRTPPFITLGVSMTQ